MRIESAMRTGSVRSEEKRLFSQASCEVADYIPMSRPKYWNLNKKFEKTSAKH